MNGTVLAWAAVAAWAAAIFIASAQPSLSTGLGTWDLILRKGAHMFVFGVLTLLVWRALRRHGFNNTATLAASIVISLAYAFTDEYHQTFVPGRTGTLYDIGFDLAGIFIAAAIIYRWSGTPPPDSQ